MFYSPSGIEVICGPMFSGKTEELIRRVRRAQIGRQRVQIFRPAIDNRYHESKVVSHSSQAIEAIPIDEAREIFDHLFDSTRVVAIDEVQFFDDSILKVVAKLAKRGQRIICAGLDQDARGIPFGPVPQLLALADNVLKVQAICTVCGGPATKTMAKLSPIESNLKSRKGQDTNSVQIGESDLYEARCRYHFEAPESLEKELLQFGREIFVKEGESTIS